MRGLIIFDQEWKDSQSDHYSEPVTLRDVCDPDELGDVDPLPDLYLDTDDLWTRDALIAMLIVAWSDDTQSTEAPF